jgi:hypothetical protein
MRLTLSVLMLYLFAAQPVVAGAWGRNVDTGFFSVTTTLRRLDGILQSENSLYGEYGAWPRLTLGVDINDNSGLAGHALVFARLPLGSLERRFKVALELGLGAHHVRGQWDRMIRSKLSVGRGFSSGWVDGWFNVDLGAELRRPNPTPNYKLDATIGLSSGRRIRPLLQLESTYISGAPLIWSVIPSILIDSRNNNATWQIGVERKTAGPSSLGLKFGLWRIF